MSGEPIFERVLHDAEHGLAGLARRMHHQQLPSAPAAPPEEDMSSILTDIKNDLAAVAAKVETLDEGAVETLHKVQADPVAMQVLTGVGQILHVPAAVQMAANFMADLQSLFAAPETAAAPAAPAAAAPAAS